MLKIFNTLSRKLETFKPIKEGEVNMYTCGPTVYNYAHIGNYRAYIFEDQLRRYLKYYGYKVTQIMNLTDVDDKTIKGSIENNIPLNDYTKKYKDAFFEDLKSLNIEPAEEYPAATDYIDDMVDIIKKLLEKGFAYKGDDNSIYFKVSKFKDYGKLSHLKLDELKAGARVNQDEYEKETAADFALWKAYDKNDGDVFWETELGKGRPGWHIECSAMSAHHLGNHFDLHTGGIDNMFPHHENEIAQSEAANDEKFVNYWMHCEHLLVENKKMSKSLGNFFTLRDLISKGHNPIAIRYLLLSTHYRNQLNFTEEGISAADQSVKKLNDFIQTVQNLDVIGRKFNEKVVSSLDKAKKGFEKCMDDDLNISGALGHIFDLIRNINSILAEKKLDKDNVDEIIQTMKMFNDVLGVMNFEKKGISDDIKKLIEEREIARSKKDWAASDRIRDELKKQGIVVEDGAEGPKWRRI